MRLRGFIDAVIPGQVRGWAMDNDNPVHEMDIFVVLDNQVVMETKATSFRRDLKEGGVGTGKYGFTANMSVFLADHQLDRVEVIVGTADGSRYPLPRYRPSAHGPIQQAAPDALTFQPSLDGTSARPVFVLGARRSGTSVIAHALNRCTRFRGMHEGHVFDLAAMLNDVLDKFFLYKSDILDNPGLQMMIQAVPRQYFDAAFAQLFRDLAGKRFTEPCWMDKTPTPEMIRAAPSLLSIWPQARFIFVRRRALENLTSQIRKFPLESFRDCCQWWADCMAHWLKVRDSLKNRAIEVDQYAIAREPERIAAMIAELLMLDPGERDLLVQFFLTERVERTAADIKALEPGIPADWTREQADIVNEVCIPLFAAYGYSADERYFVSPDPVLRACHV